MTESTSLFFHIGYPRTGTTYLQKHIFPQYEHSAVLGLPQLQSANGPEKQCSQIFLERLNALRQTVEETPQEHRRSIIYSSEDLSGNVVSDDLSMPYQIRSACPGAKIIICLRSQYSIIPSLYSYCYIKDGGTKPYDAFVKTLLKNNKFDYFRMVSTYHNLFGKKSVLVLFYESLKENPERFLRDLFRFIGIDFNPDLDNRSDERHRNPRFPTLVIQGGRAINCILASNPVGTMLNFFYPYPDLDMRVRTLGRKFFSKLNLINDRLGLYTPTPLENKIYYRNLIRRRYCKPNSELFELLGEDPVNMGYPM